VVAVVDSTPVDVRCDMERADRCIHPIVDWIRNGVSSLASLNDDQLANACW